MAWHGAVLEPRRAAAHGGQPSMHADLTNLSVDRCMQPAGSAGLVCTLAGESQGGCTGGAELGTLTCHHHSYHDALDFWMLPKLCPTFIVSLLMSFTSSK